MHKHIAFRCGMMVLCGGLFATSGMMETARAGFIAQVVPDVNEQPGLGLPETANEPPAQVIADDATESALGATPASGRGSLGTGGSVSAAITTGHSSDFDDESGEDLPGQHRKKKRPNKSAPRGGRGGSGGGRSNGHGKAGSSGTGAGSAANGLATTNGTGTSNSGSTGSSLDSSSGSTLSGGSGSLSSGTNQSSTLGASFGTSDGSGGSLGSTDGSTGFDTASVGGGLVAGSSLDNALLPINGVDGNPPYQFTYNIVPGGPGNGSQLFVDPKVAIGYNFDIISGPLFESVEIPNDLPIPGQAAQHTFNLNFDNLSFLLDAGQQFFFTQFSAGGISHFSITGIDPATGLDPNAPFDVALTFVGTGDVNFTMTPILQNPEPGSLTLLGLGGIGLIGWKWRRNRKNSVSAS